MKIFYDWILIPILIVLGAYCYVIVVGNYLYYFDMGVNNAANSLGLLFFHFPIALITMTISIFASKFLAEKKKWSVYQEVTLGVGSLIVSISLLFLRDIWVTRDYSNPLQRELIDFFPWLVERIF